MIYKQTPLFSPECIFRNARLKVLILFMFTCFAAPEVFAQPGQCNGGGCTGGTQYNPALSTTSSSFTPSHTCTWQGEYNIYNVTSGRTYEWSLCPADGGIYGGLDSELILLDDLTGNIICYSDDLCGVYSKIRWTATFTGVVRVLISEYSCTAGSDCNTVVWRCTDCVPTYDPCASVPTISACAVTSSVTLTGSGAWTNVGCGFPTNGMEKVYQFTAPVSGVYSLQIHSISLADPINNYIDFFWKPASLGCSSTSWNCINDVNAPGRYPNPALPNYGSSVPMTFVAGTTYYIMVDQEGTGTDAVTFSMVCPTAPNPCNSITTITNCGTSITSNHTAAVGAWNMTGCGFNTPGIEKIYQFTAPITGQYSLEITSATGGIISYYWRNTSTPCDNTGWNCIGDLGTTGVYPGATAMNFVAGTTYYFLLDPHANTAFSHTFNIHCPVPADPTSILPSANPICANGSVTLSVGGGIGTTSWYTASCGGTLVGTGSSITVNPSTSTTYYARNNNGYNNSAGCASVNIVTQNAPGNNTIGNNQTLCSNVLPAILTGSVPTGGIGVYFYQWETSTNNSTWNSMVGETNTIYNPTLLSQNTYFHRIVNSGICPPSTSNMVAITSIPNVTPSAIISATPGTIICQGTPVNFTAATSNTGTTPQYQWRLNGNPVGTLSTYTNSTLVGGDEVALDLTSNAQCASPTLVSSNTISFQVDPVPVLPLISYNGPVCVGSTLSFSSNTVPGVGYQWSGPAGFTSANMTDLINPAGLSNSGVYSLTHILGNCPSPQATATFSVQPPLSSSTLSGAQTLCSATLPAALTASVPTGGTGVYTYNWESSLDNSSWNSITSGTSQLFSPGLLSASNYFRAQISSGVCSGIITNSVLIWVEPSISGNILSGSQSICNGALPQVITGNIPVGGNGTYQYLWQSSNNNSTWTSLISQTNKDYQPLPSPIQYWYRRIVSGGLCNPDTSAVVDVFVGASVTNNTIGSAQTICGGLIPTQFTGTSPMGGNGTYAYSWESSLDNSTWVSISGSTLNTYSEGALFSSTYYRRHVNSGACTDTSVAVLVTVTTPILNNILGSSQTLCAGSLSTPLTGTTPLGGSGTYIYSWESSLNNSTWNTYSGLTSSGYSHGVLNSSIYYRRLVSSGPCPTNYSASVELIAEVPLGNNTIASSQTICAPTFANTLTGSLPTGGTLVYNYQWQTSSNNSTWQNFTGETNQNYVPVGPFSLTYYRRVVNSGVCTPLTSASVRIEVTPQIISNSIGSNQTICIGGTAAAITSLSPTGGTGVYQYIWETSSNTFSWTAVSGATNLNYSPGAVSANTYYRRITQSGVCVDYSGVISIQTDPSSGNNVVSSSQTICTGTVPAAFIGTTPTGGTGIYSYQWQSSANNSMWLNIAGATNQNYASPALTFTQYFRRQVTSGSCAPVNSASISVLVTSVPTATIGNNNIICPGTGAQLTISLTGHAPWNFSWSDGTNTTPVSGYTSSTYLINVTPAATTTYSVGSVVAVCAGTNSAPAVVTVTPIPTATLSGTQVICTSASANLSVNFSGLGPWNFSWTDGTTTTAVNGVTQNPYILTVSPGATRTYTLNSLFSGCPGLVSGTAIVNVYAPPGAFISSNQTICQGVGTNLSLSFIGVAPWDVVYTDGTNNFPINGINTNSYVIPVNPASTTTYRLISVSNGCTGVVAGSAEISIAPIPTVSISGNANICTGDSTRLTLNLTGLAPWSVDYTDGTNTNSISGIVTSPYVFTVTPASSGIYTLSNAFAYCAGITSGFATVNVSTPAVGFLSGNATICQGQSTLLQIGLTGSSPWDITYSEGTTIVTVNNIASSPYQFSVTPSQTTQYTLLSTSNACTGTSLGYATVIVNPVPTASLNGVIPVCTGNSAQVNINLTGVQPFSVTYSDGVTPVTVTGITSSPYSFTFTPVASTTYSLSQVFATCAGTTSGVAIVTPEAPPTAVLSGSQTTCVATPAVLTVNFTGTGPFDIVYTDGTSNFTVSNLTSNPAIFSVNPGTSSKTYNLISVTGACSGLVSGTAVVDVEVKPAAVLSAPVGFCTGVGTQLTVNITGTAPWDLSYSDGTTNYTETGIAASPHVWSITPAATATWQLTNVSNAFCTGTVLATPTVIHVSASPTVTFSGSATICGGTSTVLSVSPVGQSPFIFTYTDGTTNTSITGITSDTTFAVTPSDTTIYRIVSIASLGCASTGADTVLIEVIPAPSPAWVGSDQTICSDNSSISANLPTVGTGVWTVLSGSGVIANPLANTTTVGSLSVGLNVLQWTVSNGPCISSAQMNLLVSVPPSNANAGTDQNLCGTSTLLAASTPLNGTGTWSIVSGNAIIQDVNDPNTLVSNIALGQTRLMWTVISGVCSSTDIMDIFASTSAPIADAGPDQLICTSSTMLNATGTGLWTLVSGNPATLVNPASNQTSVSGLILGSYEFVWTTSSSGCSNTDTVVVNVIPDPVANFSYIQFGFDVDFADLSQGGVTSWDWSFGDGGISTQQNPKHTYLQAGSYNVRLIVTSACRQDTIFSTIRIFGVGNAVDIQHEAGFTVYPNPSDLGYFMLKAEGLNGDEDNIHATLRSMSGAEVYQRDIPVQGLTNLEFKVIPDVLLSKGMYMLELNYGGKRQVFKVQLQ